MAPTKTRHEIRWMIRRDMPEVLRIESASFDFPWAEEDFLTCLRQRNCIGMVASSSDREAVRGFMLYELRKERLNLLNFAVHPDHRHSGIGRAMIGRLKDKLCQQGRRQITFTVSERNLDGLLFLQRQGFIARKVLRNYYDDHEADAIVMSFALPRGEFEGNGT